MIFLAIVSFGQTGFIPGEKYTKQAAKAFKLYEEKKYLQSALSYDTLFNQSKGKGLASDKYNAACAWALTGSVEKAFIYLNKAVVEDKWSNLSHILSDSDLDTLHEDKRWQQFIKEIRTNKEKAESHLIKPLVALLDTVYKEDQGDRKNFYVIQKQYGQQSKEMDSLWKKIDYQDSVNLIRVKGVIDRYGWLGPDEVGEQGAMTFFLVIQHADSLTQVNYLPKMRKAVKFGKANPQHLALLEDRILVGQGKKQIYGSQVKRNPSTGKNEFFPIANEADVNKRRATVRLPPLEEYAKQFAIDYTLPKPKSVKNNLPPL